MTRRVNPKEAPKGMIAKKFGRSGCAVCCCADDVVGCTNFAVLANRFVSCYADRRKDGLSVYFVEKKSMKKARNPYESLVESCRRLADAESIKADPILRCALARAADVIETLQAERIAK